MTSASSSLVTTTCADAALSAGFGSVWSASTVTVLVFVPTAVTVVTNLPVTDAPAASEGIVQRPPTHVTFEGTSSEPSTNETSSGSESSMTTFVAASGPLFVAVTVHVTCSPTKRLLGLAVLTIARSTRPGPGTSPRTFSITQTIAWPALTVTGRLVPLPCATVAPLPPSARQTIVVA